MTLTMGNATVLLFGRQHEPNRNGLESTLLYLYVTWPCFSQSACHLKKEENNNNKGIVEIRDNIFMIEYKLLIFRINNLLIPYSLRIKDKNRSFRFMEAKQLIQWKSWSWGKYCRILHVEGEIQLEWEWLSMVHK